MLRARCGRLLNAAVGRHVSSLNAAIRRRLNAAIDAIVLPRLTGIVEMQLEEHLHAFEEELEERADAAVSRALDGYDFSSAIDGWVSSREGGQTLDQAIKDAVSDEIDIDEIIDQVVEDMSVRLAKGAKR